MATNAGFDYQKAEEDYRAAGTPEERLKYLQKMLRLVPKHKSSEKLQASIKERISKLKTNIERQKQSKGSGFSLSVKKEGAAQICLVGKTNSGKSTLLKELTGANVEIAGYEFTTKKPEIGTMDYQGVKMQIVEIPAIVKNFENSVLGPTCMSIMQQADLLVMLFDSPNDKAFLDKELKDIYSRRMIYNAQEGSVLMKAIWKKLGLIKVYTKQPGKEKDYPPIALEKGSSVRNVAQKVHKDFLKGFKFAKITGKSAKFKDQTVGLDHVLADDDVVELHME
tara:strand:- start:869 stop:1708 length:840 start_codon:yes stop_codon:yes gene_type:complete